MASQDRSQPRGGLAAPPRCARCRNGHSKRARSKPPQSIRRPSARSPDRRSTSGSPVCSRASRRWRGRPSCCAIRGTHDRGDRKDARRPERRGKELRLPRGSEAATRPGELRGSRAVRHLGQERLSPGRGRAGGIPRRTLLAGRRAAGGVKRLGARAGPARHRRRPPRTLRGRPDRAAPRAGRGNRRSTRSGTRRGASRRQPPGRRPSGRRPGMEERRRGSLIHGVSFFAAPAARTNRGPRGFAKILP